jgi:hypothetical protein
VFTLRLHGLREATNLVAQGFDFGGGGRLAGRVSLIRADPNAAVGFRPYRQ